MVLVKVAIKEKVNVCRLELPVFLSIRGALHASLISTAYRHFSLTLCCIHSEEGIEHIIGVKVVVKGGVGAGLLVLPLPLPLLPLPNELIGILVAVAVIVGTQVRITQALECSGHHCMAWQTGQNATTKLVVGTEIQRGGNLQMCYTVMIRTHVQVPPALERLGYHCTREKNGTLLEDGV